MVHELKILPIYYEAVIGGLKTFEVRKNDRGYQTNDFLALNEWDGEEYTGRSMLVRVLMAMNLSDLPELPEGYVAMSIRVLSVVDPEIGCGRKELSEIEVAERAYREG